MKKFSLALFSIFALAVTIPNSVSSQDNNNNCGWSGDSPCGDDEWPQCPEGQRFFLGFGDGRCVPSSDFE